MWAASWHGVVESHVVKGAEHALVADAAYSYKIEKKKDLKGFSFVLLLICFLFAHI